MIDNRFKENGEVILNFITHLFYHFNNIELYFCSFLFLEKEITHAHRLECRCLLFGRSLRTSDVAPLLYYFCFPADKHWIPNGQIRMSERLKPISIQMIISRPNYAVLLYEHLIHENREAVDCVPRQSYTNVFVTTDLRVSQAHSYNWNFYLFSTYMLIIKLLSNQVFTLLFCYNQTWKNKPFENQN